MAEDTTPTSGPSKTSVHEPRTVAIARERPQDTSAARTVRVMHHSAVKPLPAAARYFVLGMDIGGQSIGAHLYEVKNGKIASEPFWELSEDAEKGAKTLRGKDAHIMQVADIIVRAGSHMPAGGVLKAIGIGSPGRFDPDTGQIKPGTNVNIGTEGNPHEMDGVNLEEAYKAALESRIQYIPPIIVGNDGSAMLAGIIDAIHTDLSGSLKLTDQHGNVFDAQEMANKKVALFGIGTGIGHAIMQTSPSGAAVAPLTDGHASKLWVDVEPQDLQFLHAQLAAVNDRIEQINAGIERKEDKLSKVLIVEREGQVRAEDLFCAPVINAMAGLTKQDVADGKGRNPGEDSEEGRALDKALKVAGKYMARTIAVIKGGKGEDVEPGNAWSDKDRDLASQTQAYIIGGDFGGKPVGRALIRYAKEEIANNPALHEIKDIQMVQYTGKPMATRAAASMIPREHLVSTAPIVQDGTPGRPAAYR